MLHNNSFTKSGKSAAISFVLFLLLGVSFCTAQSPGELPELSADQFLERAIENYPQLKAARLEVESSEALKKTAWNLGQTQVFTGGEELKNGEGVYNVIGVQQQNIDLLGVAPKMNAQKQQVALAEAALKLSTEQLKLEVKSAYGNALVARKKLELFERIDSIYTEFEKGARLRFEVEETSKLAYLSAANQAKKMKLQKQQAEFDYATALSRLNLWLVVDSTFAPTEEMPEGWSAPLIPEEEINTHPELRMATERKNLAEANKKAVNAQYFPKFNAQYANQEILGESGFHQYQVGISIPLFFMQTRGRSQAAKIQTEIATEQLRQKEMELEARYQSALQEFLKWQSSLNFYREEALPLAEEQRRGTILAFEEGAIDYTTFIQNMREAVQVEMQAQEALRNFLIARFQLEYFLSSNNE